MNNKTKIYLQNTKELITTFPKIKPLLLEKVLEDFPAKYVTKNINVVFVSEEYIKDLNNDYRKKESVTDVLSFNMDSETLLGEVYVCAKYVKDNFVEDKQLEEILRLIIHGILHLNNFDHTTEFVEESYHDEQMYVIQEEILSNLLSKAL
ncbi:MAG TPA: rRNA maturation RNase YbeY [Candidatus Dojkabacteria bacterium]|nr:rRNA maturation RNase YbeY [Candidatus Dojkabacteria bacterium]